MEYVAYLEIQDFDSNGNLKPYVNNGKPTVIMGQGSFCGYCTKAKPAFEQLAKLDDNIVAATILTDGKQSEKAASKFLRVWDPEHRGVPAYFGFSSDGRFKSIHRGGRDLSSLQGFVSSLG